MQNTLNVGSTKWWITHETTTRGRHLIRQLSLRHTKRHQGSTMNFRWRRNTLGFTIMVLQTDTVAVSEFVKSRDWIWN